ncbi:hypothetical protein BDW74DRAFT_181784 [Aspergillus multicolor]|uniref:uncharacterized protein n=1 Tax=Aspergillus multicolor TaxID=41759 RepID=UPI003CCD04F4
MRNEEYTIGWVCALPIERAAARAMLDEIHETPVERNPSDNNAYTLGKIGPHNIVIASLPAGIYGESPAATVAAQMLSTFPSIRVGLMAGQDIGAVVQFDCGKHLADGRFIRTGSLNKSPSILLTALAELEADHELEESKMLLYMAEMLEKYPKMRDENSYQGDANDVLFESAYQHPQDLPTCNTCEHDQVVHRPERSPHPLIHYGVIASSNQAVKDSTSTAYRHAHRATAPPRSVFPLHPL